MVRTAVRLQLVDVRSRRIVRGDGLCGLALGLGERSHCFSLGIGKPAPFFSEFLSNLGAAVLRLGQFTPHEVTLLLQGLDLPGFHFLRRRGGLAGQAVDFDGQPIESIEYFLASLVEGRCIAGGHLGRDTVTARCHGDRIGTFAPWPLQEAEDPPGEAGKLATLWFPGAVGGMRTHLLAKPLQPCHCVRVSLREHGDPNVDLPNVQIALVQLQCLLQLLLCFRVAVLIQQEQGICIRHAVVGGVHAQSR